MCEQEFKPLLPAQRCAAGKAQLEMAVYEALRKEKEGIATPNDRIIARCALALRVVQDPLISETR